SWAIASPLASQVAHVFGGNCNIGTPCAQSFVHQCDGGQACGRVFWTECDGTGKQSCTSTGRGCVYLCSFVFRSHRILSKILCRKLDPRVFWTECDGTGKQSCTSTGRGCVSPGCVVQAQTCGCS